MFPFRGHARAHHTPFRGTALRSSSVYKLDKTHSKTLLIRKIVARDATPLSVIHFFVYAVSPWGWAFRSFIVSCLLACFTYFLAYLTLGLGLQASLLSRPLSSSEASSFVIASRRLGCGNGRLVQLHVKAATKVAFVHGSLRSRLGRFVRLVDPRTRGFRIGGGGAPSG